MIQRKQTLFLFLSIVSLLLIVFTPIAKYYGDFSYTLKLFSFEAMSETLGKVFSPIFNLPLIIIWALSILISFITIFLYKKRSLQMKMISIAIGLVMVFMLLIFIYYTPKVEATLSVSTDYAKCIGIYLPIVSFIFLILAYRGVRKDDKLVKSLDRLR